MEYPLCDQTVTVYRLGAQGVERQVLHGCYLQLTERRSQDIHGTRQERQFLLVVPGRELAVFPGDRVMAGEGPLQVQWSSFLPVLVPGLVQVGWVKPCYWQGELCHTEAGD